MGVVIDTDDKVVDMHGVGLHGFKNGDKQAGIAPTGLIATWFNNCQQELNNAIAAADLTPSNASANQLATGITDLVDNQRNFNAVQTFRKFPPIDPDPSNRWQWKRRADGSHEVAAGTTQTFCAMEIPGLAQKQGTFQFRISAVGTDTVTNYGNAIITGSFRYDGVGLTIQSTVNVLYDVPLAGMTLSVVNGGGLLSARVVIPALPAGKLYNLHALGEVFHVSQ